MLLPVKELTTEVRLRHEGHGRSFWERAFLRLLEAHVCRNLINPPAFILQPLNCMNLGRFEDFGVASKRINHRGKIEARRTQRSFWERAFLRFLETQCLQKSNLSFEFCSVRPNLTKLSLCPLWLVSSSVVNSSVHSNYEPRVVWGC